MLRQIRAFLAILLLCGLTAAAAAAPESAPGTPIDVSGVKPDWEVSGSDDTPVGTVDALTPGMIELKADASGTNHVVPLGWVARAEDGKVVLNLTGAEARARMKPLSRPVDEPKQ